MKRWLMAVASLLLAWSQTHAQTIPAWPTINASQVQPTDLFQLNGPRFVYNTFLTAAQLKVFVGQGIGAGTAGQIPFYGAAGSALTAQGPFTAGLPVIGAGTSGMAAGSRQGSTTTYAATNGSFVNGNCRSTDSSGNEIDSGGPCGGGGGSGTVAAGSAGQLTGYVSSGTTVAGIPAGSGVVGALANGINGPSGLVTQGGYFGTPLQLVLTNATGLPYSALPAISNGHLVANATGGSASGQDTAPSSWLDQAFCNTVGYIIVRATGSWLCSASIPLDITWEGAVCNGSTDDGTAIQTAINSGARRIYIPPTTSGCVVGGSLVITDTDYVQEIFGAGPLMGPGFSATVATGSHIIGNYSTGITFTVNTQYPVHFHDFHIDSTVTHTSGAYIQVNGNTSISHPNEATLIDNMSIVDCYYCIQSTSADNLHILNNTFNAWVDDAILIQQVINPLTGDNYIFGNRFQGIPTSGTSQVAAIQIDGDGSYNRIINNTILGSQYGVYQSFHSTTTANADLLVMENSIEEFTVAAVEVSLSGSYAFYNVMVQDNQFTRVTSGAVQSIVQVANASGEIHNCSITNNVMNMFVGVTFAMVNLADCVGGVVSGNTFNDGSTTATGIITTGSAANILAANNYPGTNISLWGALTSTTTIQDTIGAGTLPSTPANGSQFFLVGGAPGSSPCTGSSTGSMAFRQNGAWKCF